jgi:hypothetical protein
MKRVLMALAAVACMLAGASDVQGQTRADSAAVILHAAREFRAQGDEQVARALLQYLQQHFAGTVAAGEASRLLLVQRPFVVERPGRTELMWWGTTYGAWLGIALPLMADADGPAAYGVGLLVGAPAGFFAARAYANSAHPTEGQSRAITFGGSWGTYQGFGWAEALRIGDRTVPGCVAPPGEDWCRDAHGPTRVAIGVLGGLAGIGTGVILGQKPISAGTAAAASSSALWGTWFGWGAGFLLDVEDRELLATTLLAGNAALLTAGLAAPGLELTEGRVRLISAGGLVGGLAGLGLALIVDSDEEKVTVAIPLVTSALGLAAGAHYTRDRDPAAPGGAGGEGSGGALLNLDGRRWGMDMPRAGVQLQRSGGGLRPAAYVPLLSARF